MQKRTFNYFLREKAIPSPSGSRKKDVNRLVRDGNNLLLEKTGELDTQELIQSYEDGVSLEKMIARFQRGDEMALNRKQAFYADVSGYSNDLHEVMNNNRAVIAAMDQLRDNVPTAEVSDTADKNESEVKDNGES